MGRLAQTLGVSKSEITVPLKQLDTQPSALTLGVWTFNIDPLSFPVTLTLNGEGRKMSEAVEIKTSQLSEIQPRQKACGACGSPIDARAEICPKCGVRQRTPVSKTALLLLTFFMGAIGAHKFYLGKHWQGVLYIVFCWTYIPALIALVEFVIYLFTSSARLNEKYSAEGSAIVIIGVVVGFIVLLGVLAAIALPAYQDYIKKAKVAEGLTMASAIKIAIAETFLKSGPTDMSCSTANCQIGSPNITPTSNIRRVESDKSGAIIIEFDEKLFSPPRNILTITPQISGQKADLSDTSNSGKEINWICGQDATTVERKYLSSFCR